MASIFNNFPPGENLQRMGRLKFGWTDAQTIPQEMIVSKLRTEWNPESQDNMTARERMRTAMGNAVLYSTCSIKEKILGSPIETETIQGSLLLSSLPRAYPGRFCQNLTDTHASKHQTKLYWMTSQFFLSVSLSSLKHTHTHNTSPLVYEN